MHEISNDEDNPTIKLADLQHLGQEEEVKESEESAPREELQDQQGGRLVPSTDVGRVPSVTMQSTDLFRDNLVCNDRLARWQRCCALFNLNATTGATVRLPRWLKRAPFGFQAYGAYFALESEQRELGLLLADEMGLGKVRSSPRMKRRDKTDRLPLLQPPWPPPSGFGGLKRPTASVCRTDASPPPRNSTTTRNAPSRLMPLRPILGSSPTIRPSSLSPR